MTVELVYGDGEEENEERREKQQTQYISKDVAMIVRWNEGPIDALPGRKTAVAMISSSGNIS